MSGTLMLVTTHVPLPEGDDVLSAPQVVATITTNPRLLRSLQADKLLDNIAAKMGLQKYVILPADAMNVPGTQLPLFK